MMMTTTTPATTVSSRKELALTRMLVLLSIQFVIFNAPFSVNHLTRMFLPGFYFLGRYGNTYELFGGIAEVCLMTNASTNFVVYVLAGSKYRRTVREIFRCRCTPASAASSTLAPDGCVTMVDKGVIKHVSGDHGENQTTQM
jgi:hypothetical protein